MCGGCRVPGSSAGVSQRSEEKAERDGGEELREPRVHTEGMEVRLKEMLLQIAHRRTKNMSKENMIGELAK